MIVAFLQFVGLVLDENLANGQVLTYVYSSSRVFRSSIQGTLTAIPILLFATVGLFLVLYMHHSWGTMSTVMTHSQMARHIMRATMLASWVLFLWMMLHFYRTTKVASDVVREEKPVSLFQDIYTPQVTAGYVQFGSFLAILLFEVPSSLCTSSASSLNSTTGSSSYSRLTVISATGSQSSVTHSVVSVWWQLSRLLQYTSSILHCS